MKVILLYVCLLILESLFLPVLLGFKPFLLTAMLILGLIVYEKNFKTLVFQVVSFIFIAELFNGMKFGEILFPLGLVGLLYLLVSRYINFTDNFRGDITFLSIIISTLFLTVITYLYSYFSLVFDSSYNVGLAWKEFDILFTGSVLAILGWAFVISIIFKYVIFKKK